MAKKGTAHAVPDMSTYTSPHKRKGVRYLEGKEKAELVGRMRKAFKKAKVRQVEPHA